MRHADYRDAPERENVDHLSCLASGTTNARSFLSELHTMIENLVDRRFESRSAVVVT